MGMMGHDHQLIREVREDAGLKQAIVGESVNLAQNEISRMEAGGRTVPAAYIRELFLMTGDMRLPRWMFPQINFSSRRRANAPEPQRSKPQPPPGDPRRSNQLLLNVVQDAAEACKCNDRIWADGRITEGDFSELLKQERILDQLKERIEEHQRNAVAWRDQVDKNRR